MRWLAPFLMLVGCNYAPGVAGDDASIGDGLLVDTIGTDAALDAPATAITSDPYTNSAAIGFSSSLALVHTVGTGTNRLLVVGISTSFAGSHVTSVASNGVALTRAGVRDAPSQDGRVEIWTLTAPASGAAVIQILLDDASSTLIAGAGSYANVDQTTPLGPFVSAADSSGNPSLAVPSAAGELAFNVVMWNGGDYSTLLLTGSNQQTSWNRNSDDLGSCCSIVGAGASTTVVSPTFTWTVGGAFNDFWATAAVTVRPD